MPIVYEMNVAKLRSELAKHPGDMKVVVYWEDGKPDQFFGIESVDVATGEPSRDSHHKARFKFESKGPATWLFLNIKP